MRDAVRMALAISVQCARLCRTAGESAFSGGASSRRNPPTSTPFEQNLEQAGHWLSPFTGYGQSNFLVGYPEFDFETYHAWFDERFPPAKFAQLKDKMGPMVQFAIGAFIQSLGQNPGIEQYLQSLGTQCHVYVGTGHRRHHRHAAARRSRYERALRRWNEFWAAPERCAPLRRHLEGELDADRAAQSGRAHASAPRSGSRRSTSGKRTGPRRATRSREYLAEAREIHARAGAAVVGLGEAQHHPAEAEPHPRAEQEVGLPRRAVGGGVAEPALEHRQHPGRADLDARQDRRHRRIAPVAACASFGVAVKMAVDAIQRGDATAVVIGMTDPPPHEMVISAFYNANVLSADADVSRPLTGLKGTHVAGGSCVWIVGDADALMAQGFKPLGMEIVGVGTSSDAHHIITPSKGGPQLAIKAALEEMQADGRDDVGHARDGDARRRDGDRELAGDAASRRDLHRAQGNVRPRHVRRRRLGADRAAPRRGEGKALPDAADRGRAARGREGAQREASCRRERLRDRRTATAAS